MPNTDSVIYADYGVKPGGWVAQDPDQSLSTKGIQPHKLDVMTRDCAVRTNNKDNIQIVDEVRELVGLEGEATEFDENTVELIAGWQESMGLNATGIMDARSKLAAGMDPNAYTGTVDWSKASEKLKGGKGTFCNAGHRYTYGHNNYKHYCAAGTKRLMEAAGYPYISGNAKDMIPKMSQYNYKQIDHVSRYGCTINREQVPKLEDSGYTPQTGDVAIVPKVSSSAYGHMCVFLDGAWVSDTIQNGLWVYSCKDCHAYIFRS